MTKTIIIGGEQQKKKPIKFHKFLNEKGGIEFVGGLSKPSDYLTIELISLKYGEDFDLMFAYRGDRSAGVLFLGKWNDGVVE